MRQWIVGTVAVMATCAVTCAANAQDQGVELAFMPATKTVILLNEGGKYVAIDLKHIPQGGTCRMDKDALIARVGPGASPGTTRVRYAAGQVSSSGCPFLTAFDLSPADYAAARAAFVQMKDDAWKKVEQIKKDLGLSDTQFGLQPADLVLQMRALAQEHGSRPLRQLADFGQPGLREHAAFEFCCQPRCAGVPQAARTLEFSTTDGLANWL